MLRDEKGARYPLTWKSKIGKRVAWPTIVVKAIGLGEPMEMVVFLREIWKVGIMESTHSKTL